MNTNVWWDQQHLKAVVNHVFDNWPWKNILYGQAKSQRLRKIVYGIWMDSKKSCAKVFFFTLRKVAPRFYLNVFGVLRNSKGSPEASTEGSGREFWVKKKLALKSDGHWSLVLDAILSTDCKTLERLFMLPASPLLKANRKIEDLLLLQVVNVWTSLRKTWCNISWSTQLTAGSRWTAHL